MKVRCPHCGHEFWVKGPRSRPKGAGAHYAREISKLSRLHLAILEVLAKHGSSTKKRIGAILAERGIRVSGNSLSGRLSELRGMGLVNVQYTEVREVDPETKKFRFDKKPVWSISEQGRLELEMYELLKE